MSHFTTHLSLTLLVKEFLRSQQSLQNGPNGRMCSWISCLWWHLCLHSTLLQTCQGPEMKMREGETVRHSGKGAIFFGGGEHCLWCGLCLNILTLVYILVVEPKRSNSALNQLLEVTNSKSMIILQNKIQNAINQTHVRIPCIRN